jgi:hypothetical protein
MLQRNNHLKEHLLSTGPKGAKIAGAGTLQGSSKG